MIKNKFMNKNIGIWSKLNGIEWGKDLIWKSNSNMNKYQNPIYTFALSEKHSLLLEVEDFIHPSQSLYLKRITIHNESKDRQDLSLFFKQDYEHREGTAFFSLSDRTLYHEYEGSYMLFNGLLDDKGISQYTTWQKDAFQKKNIVNVENGSLLYNPICSGKVKSAFTLEATLLPYEIKHGYYWTVFGKDLNEINKLNKLVQINPEGLVRAFIGNDFRFDKIIPLSN